MLDIGTEDRAVHRPVDDEGGGHRIAAQAGQKGGGLPMAMRHPADQPLASPGPPALAGHVGGGAGLVEENQPCRIKPGLPLFPQLARRGHVRPLLLGGAHGFF